MTAQRKPRKATPKPPAEEPSGTGLGVQVSSVTPGVTPVAFVAYVQYVGIDGELAVERITSTGLTPERAAHIEQPGDA